MADEPQDMVIEILKGIQNRLDSIEERLKDIETGQNGIKLIIVSLAGHIHDIDERVEKLEQKLGS